MAPDETVYAAEVPDSGSANTHGKPDVFAALISSMAHGWEAKGRFIIAGINRRGEIVIHDGFHRSAAALAVGMPEVPVSIHFCDEDWVALKHALVKLNKGCRLYQPVDHPEFRTWPCWRKDTAARVEAIADVLPGNLIADVGCHSGAVSLGLARFGFTVKGYDINEKAIGVARRLAPMTDIGGPAFFEKRSGLLPGHKYDAVVCLSALNHQWRKGEAMGKGRQLLRSFFAAAPLLVLDCPAPGDPVAGDGEWTDPERVFRWIEDCGIGGSGRVIGQRGDELQRPLLVWER